MQITLQVMRLLLGSVILCLGLSAQVVQNSMVIRQQILGDLAQADWSNVYGSVSTASQSMSGGFSAPYTNAPGLHGADEGASVKLADGRVFVWFGDAVGVTWDQTTSKWLSVHNRTNCNFGTGNTLCLGIHPMALWPSGTDHNSCHAMENLKVAVTGSGSTQSSNCPVLSVITDSSHTGQSPRMAYQSISGAGSGDFWGAGHPPTGVFRVGTTLYGVHQAVTIDMTSGSLKTRSVLVKAGISTASINATTAPAWSKVVNWSEAPTIPQLVVTATNGNNVVTRTSGTATSTGWADTGVWEGVVVDGVWHLSGTRYTVTNVSGNTITLNQNVSCGASCTGLQFIVMPKQEINTGKFAEGSCELLASADVPAGINSQLPAPLQGEDVLFCFGASYGYRKSNIYLGVMKADTTTIEAATYSNGLSNMYYLTGVSGDTPTWTLQDEDSAVALFGNWDHVGVSSGLPCVGENSVRWHPLVQRWVATYGSAECGGIWARASDGIKPWVWAREVRVLVNHNQSTGPSSWHAGIVHSPSNDNYNFTLTPPVYDPDSVSPYTQFDKIYKPAPSNGSPFALDGNAYGPYQLPADSDVKVGNTVTMFTTIGTFNPYVVWMASFTMTATPLTTLTGVISGKAGI